MSQKIKCPECKVEFNMEEGLSSHLKTIENDVREQIQKEQGDKIKESSEKVRLLTSENEEKKLQIQKINLENENKEKAAVKIAIEATKKDSDKDNKAHYESLYEAKFQERTENLNEMNSEKQKLWGLKEKRLIETIEDLQKKATQGTTVDQGSSSEMQLGDFLKKIFKDKNDKITEYAKGVAGGDWLQEVIENNFTVCKILYERKNTKNWSNDWIKKLQDDMKDSKSDVGIIFTRATPKDFPKDVPWDHKGNIFICKYDFTALRALATTQRWYLADKNKQKENTQDNVLSAIDFIENPIIKNLLMQQINVSDKKKKKLDLTMKNLTDVIELNENMESNLEELFSEIDKIGISEFLSKWKKKF
ncbi:DUF2130 domain-containing protein [Candidatus Pelagibacter sp.]|jgi:hypothetical protein|nr:DUF2130 domain-containing protein [Candidatus Pelagibacter sp.]